MHKYNRFVSIAILLSLMIFAGLFTGCSEQPVGYIFSPTNRHQSTLARTTAEVVNAIYHHADQAAVYLDRASLTDDYISLLEGGWLETMLIDTTTGQPYTLYYRSYLDQEHYILRFDREPMAEAVRTPSSLDYTFLEIKSYQNRVTNEFYGNVSDYLQISIEYANNRQNHRSVDGWFEIQRTVVFEEEIETAGAGTVTVPIYVGVSWQVKVENYSIDTDDQRSGIIIDGIMPIYDDAGEYHRTQVSGRIDINSRGQGFGEIWLYGEPAARIYFTGRSFGFRGYFTLYEEDFKKIYALE